MDRAGVLLGAEGASRAQTAQEGVVEGAAEPATSDRSVHHASIAYAIQ